jgi:fructokinase
MIDYPVACFGEVLWDILPDKALPGGALLNVAYHLNKLSVNVALITSLGEDFHGQQLLQLMQQYGLTTDFVQRNSHHETGKVFAQLAAHNEMKYDIQQPVAWDFIHPTPQLQVLTSTPGYLIFGSLASRTAVTRQTLMTLLESRRQFVFDINLRAPHYTPELITMLLQHTNILKINEAELALLSTWHQLPTDREAAARALSQQFSIPTIVVTLGEHGAALLQDEQWHQHPGYKVTVADTIGSGDAFLAGFIQQTLTNSSATEALSFACAMGALVASYPGGCPDYSLSEINVMGNE